MTRIKICGLTNAEDALAAAGAGADALGFVFAPSPRRVSPDKAREIIKALPPLVCAVGVFVNSPEDEVRAAVDYCGLDFIQLHGGETPEFCARFQNRAIKAVRMDQAVGRAEISAYQKSVRALLVDSGPGGTGKTFKWEDLPLDFDRTRLILAGGLNPDNVKRAIEITRPWAVDVSSGVERAPGLKDKKKMAEFIARVREADNETE